MRSNVKDKLCERANCIPAHRTLTTMMVSFFGCFIVSFLQLLKSWDTYKSFMDINLGSCLISHFQECFEKKSPKHPISKRQKPSLHFPSIFFTLFKTWETRCFGNSEKWKWKRKFESEFKTKTRLEKDTKLTLDVLTDRVLIVWVELQKFMLLLGFMKGTLLY